MSFGVDTIGLAFPIDGAETRGATATVAQVGTDEEVVTYRRKLPGGGFLAWGKSNVAWVEASLPKRAGEHNIEAVDAATALELAEDLHREATEYVGPCPGVVYQGREGVEVNGWHFDQAAIKRLDIVRDFDNVAVGPMLDGLASVRRSDVMKVRRFADAESGGSETLRVGVKSAWSTVLYDKHAETGGVAPPGRLRYEARLRDGFLTSQRVKDLLGGALPDLRRLRQDALAVLGRERFEHVGFNRTVSGTDSFAARINASDLSPREKRDLIAYIAAEQLGIDLGFHRHTIYKYRRLAAQVGLQLGSRVAPDVSMRLDLEQGEQVFTMEHEDGHVDPA